MIDNKRTIKLLELNKQIVFDKLKELYCDGKQSVYYGYIKDNKTMIIIDEVIEFTEYLYRYIDMLLNNVRNYNILTEKFFKFVYKDNETMSLNNKINFEIRLLSTNEQIIKETLEKYRRFYDSITYDNYNTGFEETFRVQEIMQNLTELLYITQNHLKDLKLEKLYLENQKYLEPKIDKGCENMDRDLEKEIEDLKTQIEGLKEDKKNLNAKNKVLEEKLIGEINYYTTEIEKQKNEIKRYREDIYELLVENSGLKAEIYTLKKQMK